MTEPRRDLLLHPVRLRIVQALIARPLTPGEIHQRLGDVAQATLYRHIALLEESGLIEVVSERQVRGGTERTFQVVSEAVSLGESDLAGANRDDHFRYFATFVGTLMADFAAYLDAGDPELAADRVGYRQIPMWLSDAEFDAMAAEIRDAIGKRLDNEPTPGRRRRLFTTVVMPDARHTDD